MQTKRLPLWIAFGAIAIASVAAAQVVQTPLAGSTLPLDRPYAAQLLGFVDAQGKPVEQLHVFDRQ